MCIIKDGDSIYITHRRMINLVKQSFTRLIMKQLVFSAIVWPVEYLPGTTDNFASEIIVAA
jgi:hypothetical protein